MQRRLSPSELNTAKQDIAYYYEQVDKLGLDAEYRSYLRGLSARAYMSRLEELKLRYRHEIEVLHSEQQRLFTQGMMETYEDSYYHTIFDIQQGIGVGGSFTTLNTQAIERAVSQKWLGDNYVGRIGENKDRLVQSLDTIIPRGIALGQNPLVIARDIRAATGTSRYNAERLARTEFNHIANEATRRGYKETGVAYYKFLATLDHKTSTYCQDMDGLTFEVSEAITGVNYPPLHPHCRSSTTPHFPPDEIDAMFEEATRLAKDENGKYYKVPADMRYAEWKKSLTLIGGSAILKSSDIQIGRSVGAAAFRDTVLLPDGRYGEIAEDTEITKVVTFAGVGTNTVYRSAPHMAKIYGGVPKDWRKVRGDGYVEVDGLIRHAELHWAEEKGAGRVEMKVKRWFD